MGKTFARIHASSVGTFDQGDKVPQWLKANGGQFSRNVDCRVTHLIASLDAWENNAEAGTGLTKSNPKWGVYTDTTSPIFQCKRPRSWAL